jgi:DNA mismatch repair protein MutS
MIERYLRHQEEYVEKYSERCVVLMQIGSFYEMYEFNPEKCDEKYEWPVKRIGVVNEIGPLLNMQLTRRDKGKAYTLSNCDMIGFPVIAYEKHRDVILQNDYTIVRFDQRKNSKDEIERFVAEILSPSTNLENIANLPVSNNIVSIYIEILKKSFHKEDYIVAVGMSSIDVTTGCNNVLEIYSQDKNAIHALQEVYRYLSILHPREMILILEGKDDEYLEFLHGVLNLDKYPTKIVKKGVEKDFIKVEYQNKFLTKLFGSSDLGLDRIAYGRIS